MFPDTAIDLVRAQTSPLLVRHLFADGDPGPIVGALANVPELCEVAVPFIGAALSPSAVDFRLKEIAILRTSANLACKFCVNAHTVVAFQSGLTHGEIRALRGEDSIDETFDSSDEVALIAWIDALTTGAGAIDPQLSSAVIAALGQHRAIELNVTIGATMLLNRFATGFGLPTSDDTIQRLAELGFADYQKAVPVAVAT